VTEPISGIAKTCFAESQVFAVIGDAGVLPGPERRRRDRERAVVEPARILERHLADHERGPLRVVIGQRVPAGFVEVVIHNDAVQLGSPPNYATRLFDDDRSTHVNNAKVSGWYPT